MVCIFLSTVVFPISPIQGICHDGKLIKVIIVIVITIQNCMNCF